MPFPKDFQKPAQIASAGGQGQNLARPGGAANRGSLPIQMDRGSVFAAMQSKLMSGLTPDEKKAVGGGNGVGRQFNTLAAGGDQPGPKSTPTWRKKLDSQAQALDSKTALKDKIVGSIRRVKKAKESL